MDRDDDICGLRHEVDVEEIVGVGLGNLVGTSGEGIGDDVATGGGDLGAIDFDVGDATLGEDEEERHGLGKGEGDGGAALNLQAGTVGNPIDRGCTLGGGVVTLNGIEGV